MIDYLDVYQERLAAEQGDMARYRDASKDIIVVVHDQLPYFKTTVESLLTHTDNYHLYVWDNNSRPDTCEYLQELSFQLGDRIDVMRSDTNVGFIHPNNELARWGSGEYLVLLNSDVELYDNWDRMLLGVLQARPDVRLVGCEGGLVDERGIGGRPGFGYNIDYVCGWCLALARSTYEQYGLFNPELKFAYAEDSDLGFRLQSRGHKIYALYSRMAHHFENKTIHAVHAEKEVDVVATFNRNHEIIASEWGTYLREQRIDIRRKVDIDDILNGATRELD